MLANVLQMQTSPKLDLSGEALASLQLSLRGAHLEVGPSVGCLSACSLESLFHKLLDGLGLSGRFPGTDGLDEVLTY